MDIAGWDIGGVNVKLAVTRDGGIVHARCQPFEIQRAPHGLPSVMQQMLAATPGPSPTLHAVTMTAELSQMFLTKRDGVEHILAAVDAAFPHSPVFIYGTDGEFYRPEAARRVPLCVAAANWAATAASVAADIAHGILIDIGTTTTDIIPFADGRHAATGRTDPERLASGELVYTGAVRTPVEATVRQVPFRGGMAGVSAEAFALAGDVHVWRGALSPDDYSAPTPDGRPATLEFAGVRLARVICADRDILSDGDITAIADAVADAQIASIADAIRRVHALHPRIQSAIVTGVGAFLATKAARRANLEVVSLADRIGSEPARCAPAAAVALLLDRALKSTADPA